MNPNDETYVAWMKIVLTWLGAFFAAITLSKISALLVIIFTGLQIEKQLRERRRDKRREAFEDAIKENSDETPV